MGVLKEVNRPYSSNGAQNVWVSSIERESNNGFVCVRGRRVRCTYGGSVALTWSILLIRPAIALSPQSGTIWALPGGRLHERLQIF